MAIIKCPECGNDISDQTKMCPQCGFPMDSVNNDWNSRYNSSEVKSKSKKTIKLVLLITGCVIGLFIIFSYIVSMNANPFRYVNTSMTKSDVRKQFGEPDKVEEYDFLDSSFDNWLGLGISRVYGEGTQFTVWYDEYGYVKGAWWNCWIPQGKSLVDYKGKINRVRKSMIKFGENYDKSSYNEDYYNDEIPTNIDTVHDKYGGFYDISIKDEDDGSAYINVWYTP